MAARAPHEHYVEALFEDGWKRIAAEERFSEAGAKQFALSYSESFRRQARAVKLTRKITFISPKPKRADAASLAEVA